MPVPPDFHWTTRSVSLPNGPLTVIACDTVWVVSLFQRVDDESWIVSLDRHQNGPGGPTRPCTSYEQGRIGAELWVTKHEARLREDVTAINRWREAVRANRLAKLVSRRRSGGSSRKHIGSHVLLQLHVADT